MGAEICFDGYLKAIINTHQKWQEWYTPTDATGKDSLQVERDRPAFFDFGLMVQTVEPPKERELGQDLEKKEKTERLPVMEGICKYAAEHVLLVGRQQILAFIHKHDPALEVDESGIKNKNILCILNVLDFIYKVSELNYGS